MFSTRVLITGSGDLASAAALRLFRSGFKVTLFASDRPMDIHHNRTFSNAVYNGEKTLEQITACTRSGSAEKGDCQPETALHDFVKFTLANRQIPIFTEEDLAESASLLFEYVFSAETELFEKLPARLTENSVHISKRGYKTDFLSHYQVCTDPVCLGRVVYPFNRDAFAERPEEQRSSDSKETVKAPLEGVFTTQRSVGSHIHEKQELGRINDIPILSPVSGKISGLLNSGLIIPAGTVFAEICSLSDPVPVKEISAASLSIAGAVLEALLYDLNLKK